MTADHISGGRVELGIGTGWHEGEHAAYGFPFAPMGERMDVLEEQLQVVLGNWGSSPEQPFSFAGAALHAERAGRAAGHRCSSRTRR